MTVTHTHSFSLCCSLAARDDTILLDTLEQWLLPMLADAIDLRGLATH